MKTLFTLLIMLLSMVTMAQHVFICNKSKINFFSEARLENIEAYSVKGASAFNVSTKEVVFKVSIRSFQFSNSLMQEHFNENYMESEKYPDAVFKGKITDVIDLTKDGTYTVTVSGSFTVHGISKEREIKGTLIKKGDKITIDSDFILAVADHKIDIPNDKLSNISQDIKITLHAEYILKK